MDLRNSWIKFRWVRGLYDNYNFIGIFLTVLRAFINLSKVVWFEYLGGTSMSYIVDIISLNTQKEMAVKMSLILQLQKYQISTRGHKNLNENLKTNQNPSWFSQAKRVF